MIDTFSKKVFSYNADSKDATVINTPTNKVVKKIPLGGNPEFSVTNNKGLIYVNIEATNEIKTIDASSLKVLNTGNIAPGVAPSGLAIDLETNRVFSVCSNKLMIILDAKTGKIIKALPIGDGCDGVAFDAKSKLAFSSNREGTVTLVKENKANSFSVLEIVKTQRGAKTIALNHTTHQLYANSRVWNKTRANSSKSKA